MYTPRPTTISQLKSKILRPATTSNFQCWFPPPVAVANWIVDKKGAGIDFTFNRETFELISLNCVDASLPGSTFATNEIVDDYTGVTERHAYRRQYDDRTDFTFLIDNSVDNPNSNSANYRVLLFFELWKEFIANEQQGGGLEDTNYFYRMNYPKEYQTPYIILNKFEKDFKGNYLQYKFLQAYPIAVNTIPVSYESTQLLKCTVSFTYTRYTIKTEKLRGLPTPNRPAVSATNIPTPNNPITTNSRIAPAIPDVPPPPTPAERPVSSGPSSPAIITAPEPPSPPLREVPLF